jgi:mRNA interferase RelE/StbE
MGGLMPVYRLLYSETSRNQIKKLHPELKSVIRARIDRLRTDPLAGKRLERELSGYLSLRAGRYRIIYRLDEDAGVVEIHSIGHRRNIYELMTFFHRSTP